MLAIIGGSGLTKLSTLAIARRELVRTPYGEPCSALVFGQVAGRDAVFLARHGHTATRSRAAGAGLQLDFAGTNRVASLLLAETNQVGGVYNSSNAAPYLTGPGSLEVIAFLPPPPTIDSATVSGTNLVISVSTLLYLNYVLQSATNLSPTINWQSESTNTGTGGPLLLNVPIEPATPRKFLRIWVY